MPSIVEVVRIGVENEAVSERHAEALRQRSRSVAQWAVIGDQEKSSTTLDPFIDGVALWFRESRGRVVVIVLQFTHCIRDNQYILALQTITGESRSV